MFENRLQYKIFNKKYYRERELMLYVIIISIEIIIWYMNYLLLHIQSFVNFYWIFSNDLYYKLLIEILNKISKYSNIYL